MLIAEQNVLYVHSSRNQMELQHKRGAENVDMTLRATSYLKTIQPLHLPLLKLVLCTLAYEVVDLRFSR